MLRYIAKRFLYMIPTLIGVTIIVFVLMSITPGDPVRIKLGDGASPEAYMELKHELGLDQPYIIQFTTYVKNALQGDLGKSFRNDQSVAKQILQRLPTTFRLATLSVICATVVGISIGVLSAVRQYSLLDNIATAIALFGVSAPAFWVALMLILVFSVRLGWLPSSGTYGWQYWILPVATLSMQHAATIMRFTRTAMLDVIRQDYIQTARAKGQKESVVVIRHALHNAMIPVVTVLGNTLCTLLSGSILVESIFSIPGLGKFVIDSVTYRDRPSVQGAVLVMGCICCIINLIVDLLYGFIDPRIKSMYQTSRKPRKEKI